ncbi:hypothetical protein [Blastococcus brunescens]|uniref:Uncharacterized protein n=1 Tax=Blastococcus brunescens TaxID=1564165 RepID=A0ABZ1B0A8_9ACTN|nr:hypothetical protein [Blastococcus sp. BMG 8361]WRL64245.1 hypothetical protein U6N30_32650 [Blastococcus sp. BMG 8361]
MSELDELVNACLMPGFAGTTVPAWVTDSLDRGLAGVCLYGANLTGGPDGSAAGQVRSSARPSSGPVRTPWWRWTRKAGT